MNVGELRRLVARYMTGDPEEGDFLRQLSTLVNTVEDPWNRDRFEPGHVTASAFVLDPDREAVALVLHEKLERWVQPGGHVEPADEDHERAARREVEEECLIRELDVLGPLDVDVHRFPARTDQPAHLHFDLRWAFVAHRRHAGIGHGVVDVRWVSLGEMVTMDDTGIVRAARKLRELR